MLTRAHAHTHTVTHTYRYTLLDGDAFRGDLDAVQVLFRDMLVPLLLPEGHSAPVVFAALWGRLRAASSVTAQGGGGGGLAGPIETVVVVRGVSGVDVQRKLAGLIVRAASSSTAGEMRFEAGGLLLPRTHVLMKGHVSGGRCTMRLLTDSHRVIPFVEAYLAA